MTERNGVATAANREAWRLPFWRGNYQLQNVPWWATALAAPVALVVVCGLGIWWILARLAEDDWRSR